MAYLQTFTYRFSSTRQMRRLSARIRSGSGWRIQIRSRLRPSNRSANSPFTCCTSSFRFRFMNSSLIFPELIFDASTRSSVSCFRRCDFFVEYADIIFRFLVFNIFPFQQIDIINNRSKRCLDIVGYVGDQIRFLSARSSSAPALPLSFPLRAN